MAKLGQETIEIIERGHYCVDQTQHNIREAVKKARKGTKTYKPNHLFVLDDFPVYETTEVRIRNETSLEAAKQLVDDGFNPVVLNFASATRPGGGFLTGSVAQEESLARASALFACIHDDPMYKLHKEQKDPMYTDHMIYSPNVPVIRIDDVLAEPYNCAFITSAAPNRSAMKGDIDAKLLNSVLSERISKILGVAAENGHDAIVLGAWGCGVFGNDPHIVAELFKSTIDYYYPESFKIIHYAILDWSDDKDFIGPFMETYSEENDDD